MEDYLGGVYYLTPDEIIIKNNIYIIQESKNSSSKSLPSLDDIQDGLFKLILFSNLHSLNLNESQVHFMTKLKLTGKNLVHSIIFPDATSTNMEDFLEKNNKVLKTYQKKIIRKLAEEATNNKNIQIEVTNNG